MNAFEIGVRQKLRKLGPENKKYLKKNYKYEIFIKHNLQDYEVEYLFDMKKIEKIYPNLAFQDERIDAEVNISKEKKIKVIFQFDPIYKGKRLKDKVGIITAFTV